MLQAIILICNVTAGVPECDAAHAIFTGRPVARYADAEKCHQGALEYLHTFDFEGVLEEGHDYQITVSCPAAPL